jgi:hypothetical protein
MLAPVRASMIAAASNRVAHLGDSSFLSRPVSATQ